MLSISQPCFIAIPNPQNHRVLIPGSVVQTDGDRSCQVLFDEPLTLSPGEEVSLFAKWQNQFHQQGAKVCLVESQAGRPLISLDRVGEPTNCESRSCYRVSVVSQDIRMKVGDHTNALLADVSGEGISVIVPRPMMVGMTVDIDLAVGATLLRGKLRVQSEKKLANGRLRYGLYAPERKSPLRKSLESLSSLMQRMQLQRRAGAA